MNVTKAKIKDGVFFEKCDRGEGLMAVSSRRRRLTRLLVEGNRLLQLHPSVSERKRQHFLLF